MHKSTCHKPPVVCLHTPPIRPLINTPTTPHNHSHAPLQAYTMGIIIGVLLLGFSTTLYAAYHHLLPPYGSFGSTFRIIFGTLAGDIHLEVGRPVFGGRGARLV